MKADSSHGTWGSASLSLLISYHVLSLCPATPISLKCLGLVMSSLPVGTLPFSLLGCCSLCLEVSYPPLHLLHSYLSFRFQAQLHFVREVFPDLPHMANLSVRCSHNVACLSLSWLWQITSCSWFFPLAVSVPFAMWVCSSSECIPLTHRC